MEEMLLNATWTFLLHGESKTGKSWLSDTLPGPRLHIDLEGRGKYLPTKAKVLWNIDRDAPPEFDGSWEVCVAPVTEYETLARCQQWLRSGQHPFVAVTIDSLMEAQKRAKDIVVPGIGQLQTQDWGELLRRLEKLIREYRDLTLVPETGIRIVVFITGTENRDEVMTPMLEGAMRKEVPYHVDTVGYYFKAPQPDGSFVRSLLVDQQPGFIAGDGTGVIVGRHGPIVPNPNLTELYTLLNQSQEAA